MSWDLYYTCHSNIVQRKKNNTSRGDQVKDVQRERDRRKRRKKSARDRNGKYIEIRCDRRKRGRVQNYADLLGRMCAENFFLPFIVKAAVVC